MLISEKNKELLTETAISGTELQESMAKLVAKDIIDVYHAHNVRLVDINFIHQMVSDTITAKNEEKLVEVMGKEKLETFSAAFGGSENVPANTIRNVRIQDIFTS